MERATREQQQIIKKGDGYYLENGYGREVKILNSDATPAFTFLKVNTERSYGMIDPEYNPGGKHGGVRMGSALVHERVSKKWKVDKQSKVYSGHSSAIKEEMYLDLKENKVKFYTRKELGPLFDIFNNKEIIRLSRLIPSHLLLYRLCNTFNRPPGIARYMDVSLWNYNLIHKETGETVTFSEFKGAMEFYVKGCTHEDMIPWFKMDLVELVSYLLSDQCAYGYDECTSGQVA